MTAGPHLVVAMPARNEEARIGAALAALQVSAAALRAGEPDATVTIVVAADACSDRTAEIAVAAGATVVTTAAGRVGAARAAAVRAGLAAVPEALWIANTDADSQVPEDWLSTHLSAARNGVGLLLGSVRPDPRELDAALLARWLRRNPPGPQHRNVHGANLGVQPALYLAAGGFADVAEDEDVGLAHRCRAAGARVLATDTAPVLTSARRHGRTPGGFSGYLRALGAVE